MGPSEKCRHKKGSRDQPGCRQPRTLKTTLVLWACGPYVAKPHPEHHAIRKSAWEETSGQTKEALAQFKRRLQNLGSHRGRSRPTGEGPGEVDELCHKAA